MDLLGDATSVISSPSRFLSTRSKRSRSVSNRYRPYSKKPISPPVNKKIENDSDYEDDDIVNILLKNKDLDAYFQYSFQYPQIERELLNALTSPTVPTEMVSLPYTISKTIPDTCVYLTDFGCNTVVHTSCTHCKSDRHNIHAPPTSALHLKLLHQINYVGEYKDFYTSVKCFVTCFQLTGTNPLEIYTRLLNQPTLFYAMFLWKEWFENSYCLVKEDFSGHGRKYGLVIAFTTPDVHLSYKLVKHMNAILEGYDVNVHIFNKSYLLAITQTSNCTEKPVILPVEDIWQKYRDLVITEDTQREYEKKYREFETFSLNDLDGFFLEDM